MSKATNPKQPRPPRTRMKPATASTAGIDAYAPDVYFNPSPEEQARINQMHAEMDLKKCILVAFPAAIQRYATIDNEDEVAAHAVRLGTALANKMPRNGTEALQ